MADATGPRAANLVERTAAYLVDAIVTFVLFVLAALVVAMGDLSAVGGDPSMELVLVMLFLVVPFLYFVTAEGVTGTTLGKRSFGLRVVGEDGRPAGLYAATVRNILRLAWALGPVGPIFLASDVVLLQWTEDDRRLGDVAARTRVVRLPRRQLNRP